MLSGNQNSKKMNRKTQNFLRPESFLRGLVPFFFFLFSFIHFSSAQDWSQKMMDPSVNFYDVQQSFNQYWAGKTIEKGKGWKQFKRWEWFMEPRVFPTGDRATLLNAAANYKVYRDSIQMLKAPLPGNWTFLGPGTVPTGGGGAGRVNCIRFDPANSNNIFIGTPAGGLWKSTNGGTSWTTNTDQLTVLGVSDIAIDPTNSQIIYIATGDGDAGDTYSIGVLKSTDGGTTWNSTGLSWTVNQVRTISRLLINPNSPSTLLACTSNGIYRTTDAGASWTQTLTGGRKDIEFKPGDPNTVYTCGVTFWKSTNGGASFTQITSGLPASANVDRLAIAVTAADPAYVYVLAGRASDSGFYGFYRSTDSGTTFTTRATTPNLLGWSSTGSDTGGQSWYDLSVAASPTNRDVVVVGGVNLWRSTNGGTSWSINGHWTGTGAPYVHADHHALEFLPGSGTTYFSGCDGGIFKTTNSGSAWTDFSSNLQIGQLYRLSNSATNANLTLSGWQDNGTNRSNPNWARVIGGDGMECIIDYSNANIMYGELYYGEILKSTNGGTSFGTTIASSGGTGVNADGNWVTPYIMHPTSNQTLIVGKGGLYRTTNGGTSWSTLGALSGGSGNVVAIAYAPSNPNYIYAAKSDAMYVSTNGGTSFNSITTGLPTSSASITYISVSNTNPSKVWVSFSGFSSGNKVFLSTNAGTSWTNYSTGLPNLPANCLVYQNGSSAGIYVGMDVGVYYRDSLAPSWQAFNSGLPNVVVDELEIQYSSGKIRAATFGRGMWESTLFTAGNFPPSADFSGNPTSGCAGSSVQFTDLSSYTPTSWAWTFSGGNPSTSTQQNPSITYNTTGSYDVTLIACNTNGCDTITKTQYISITGVQPLPLVEGFQSLPFLPANWILHNPDNDNAWQRATTVGGYGTSTACAYYNNYSVDVTGTKDAMYTPKYDFSGLTSASLSFDVAYARYDATYSDTLAVFISLDCGATFTQIYLKGGSTLATAPDLTTSNFMPTNSQWRTETVSLNSYLGQSKIMLSFENRSGYGQYLFVDNINITGVGGAAPVAAFSASATTICAGDTISFSDQSTGNPTSWSWTFGGGTPATSTAQNPSVVFNTAGTYSVTLTATNSSGSDPETKTNYITVNAIPAVSVTPSPATICAGSSTSLTASGATTYSWSPSTGLSGTTGATVTASPSTSTTYTVTGTSSGCSGVQNVSVNVNPAPTVTVSPNSSSICSGASTTLTASGATTYSWSPATGLSGTTGSSVTANPTTTTTYIVTGTQSSCTDTQSVTVSVTPLPSITVTPASPGICSGGSTSLTASGATTYTWSPATGLSGTTGATVTASPSSTTTYSVAGTQGSCTGNANVTVTVNPIPAITVSPSPATICSGNSTSLSASGATTYSWSPGTGLGSTTGAVVTANPSATTTYTVTGTTSGCSGNQTVTVNVTALPTITVTPSSATICEGNSTTLTASGATSYSWSPATGLSGTTGATVVASPSATTTYTVTGTQNGCSNVNAVTVSVGASPVISVSPSSPTICSGSSTSLTASGATTYSWFPSTGLSSTSGAIVSANPGSSTTYTITGTTGGCTGTTNVTVNVTALPIVSVTPDSSTICEGASTTLTASGASAYTWSPSTGLSGTIGITVTASPTTTTTYTVSGTQSGCAGTKNVTVYVTPSPVITVTPASPSICTGGSTMLSASGASSYSWSPGTGLSGTTGASVNANPVSTTTYTVTGSQNGCSGNKNVTVTVNPIPVININPLAPTVCEGSSASLTASGATTYLWSPSSGLSDTTGATVSANPSSTTTYSVAGTQSGCTGTQTVTVSVTPLPVISVSPPSTTICLGNSVLLVASGAGGYSWSPAGGLNTTTGDSVIASPIIPATYTVSGSANGCSNSTIVTVNVGLAPVVTVSPSTIGICNGNSATLIASGAESYSWSPAGTLSASTGDTVTATPASTTTYTVTGSTSGCLGTSSTNVTVNVNSPPVITVSPASPSVCSNQPVTLTASGSGDFTWSPVAGLDTAAGSSVVANPSSTTTFTATETTSGCSSSASALVTVTPAPVLALSASSDSLCLGDSTQLSASGASTYSWSPSAELSSGTGDSVMATPSASTIITCVGTLGACSDTATISIEVGNPPTVLVSTSADTICAGDTAVLTASGATNYLWTPASGLSDTTGSIVNAGPAATTTYFVTGSMNGCAGTVPATVSIVVVTPPAVTVTPANPTICSGDSVSLSASGSGGYSWSPAAGLSSTSGTTVTATPTATTNYIVSETQSGCNGSTAVTVTVSSLPIINVSAASDSICSGDSVLIIASGASTYFWTPSGDLSGNSGDSVTATPASNATYTVTGTQGGCSGTGSVSITVIPSPSISVSSNISTICNGDTAILSATGASSYSWSPATGLSATTGSIVFSSPPSATTYSVTGILNGCQSVNPATITIYVSQALAVSVSPSNANICTGDSVSLSASGASSFSWSPGAGLSSVNGTTVTASPANTTTYSVVETQSGCNGSSSVTVTVTNPPTVTVSSSSGSLCSGDSVVLSASGAAFYTWSPSLGLSDTTGNTVTATPGSSSVYFVTGWQGACSDTASIAITVNPSPSVSVSASSDTLCVGDTATLTASGAGTYSWSPPTGLSSTTGSSVSANPASTTSYSVSGTLNGCAGQASTVTISVAQPLGISVSPASPSVCPGYGTTLVASGANDFVWSPTSTLDTSAGNIVISSPLNTTTYTVTETESGCNGTATVTVSVNSLINVNVIPVSDTICFGDSVLISATGASTYTWFPSGSLSSGSGSSVIASPTANTLYSVVGTSGNCSDTAVISVSVTPLPTITINASTTSICPGNSSILSASGASVYSWTPSAELNTGSGPTVVASPTATTIFSVSGTNLSGCTNVNSITITVNPIPVISVSPASISICPGDSAFITAIGNSTIYSWLPAEGLSNPSDISTYASPDSSTLYVVTGTDDNGCTNSSNVSVTLFPALVSNTTFIDASCDSQDGKAIAVAGGGTTPFTYIWSDSLGQTGAIAQGLSPGTYFVTITDANGCSTSDSAAISLSSSLSVTITASGANCGGNDGEAMVFATGGPLPYSYLWSDSSTVDSLTGITAGTYQVTVSDNSGCVKFLSVEVGTKPPKISKYIIHESCEGKSDGSVAITISEGTSPYSYHWSNEEATEDIAGLQQGIYQLTVTDSAGCSSIDSAIVELLAANCLNIPSGFTPNGDGKNDLWKIRGVEEFPDIMVEIFNRWGTKVFSSKGYKEPWDGGGLPSASYYFIITLNDEQPITGTVTILR